MIQRQTHQSGTSSFCRDLWTRNSASLNTRSLRRSFSGGWEQKTEIIGFIKLKWKLKKSQNFLKIGLLLSDIPTHTVTRKTSVLESHSISCLTFAQYFKNIIFSLFTSILHKLHPLCPSLFFLLSTSFSLSSTFLYFLYLLLYLSLISLSHNVHKEVGTNIPYPMYTYPSYTTLSHNSTILLFLPSTSVINYKWHILTRQGNDEDMENSFL